MKKVSFIRATLCFLVLLSFVGTSLSRLTASAQERAGQESRVRSGDSQTTDTQEQKAKKPKAKGDKGEIRPQICNDCDPGDDGGGYTGDGHIWCDGWDRQGDCAFNHVNAATSVEFRRLRGNNGYDWQTFLTWNPGEF